MIAAIVMDHHSTSNVLEPVTIRFPTLMRHLPYVHTRSCGGYSMGNSFDILPMETNQVLSNEPLLRLHSLIDG